MMIIKQERKFVVPKPRGLKVLQCEADILRDCKKYLESRDDLCWRRMEGSGKYISGRFIASETKGFPDLLILNKGKLFLAELKVPGNTISDSQVKFIFEFCTHGAICGVVCSLNGLKRFLTEEAQDNQITVDNNFVPIWY